MLGRKQSLKGEPVLADYGPEESLNESADIEWVNKVRVSFIYFVLMMIEKFGNGMPLRFNFVYFFYFFFRSHHCSYG